MRGYLSLILHAHLPFVRHPEHEKFLEENWLFEAIIETYRTIEFFIKRINQILALVEAIVDSIANIAAGKISAAANYVEKTLAPDALVARLVDVMESGLTP